MNYTAAQIKELSEKELHELLSKLRGEQRQMRFLIRQGEWREMHKIHQTKKAIARVLTVLAAKNGELLTDSKKQG